VKRILLGALLLVLAGCGAEPTGGGERPAAAALRGFGIDVDQAVSARISQVHLKTCGGWGCHEQDVPLSIAGPTSAAPCPQPATGPDAAACGPIHLTGPGPGYGYAPVPELTTDPVTVTVTTPPGALVPIAAEVRVRPRLVCPPGDSAGASTCAGGTPQARLHIAANGTVTQKP
jgi:hypothetical protein